MIGKLSPEERVAAIAGAVTATGVLGWLIYGKVQELQSAAKAAEIERYVAVVIEQEAVRYLMTTYGMTPERINAIDAFSRRLSR